MIITSFIRFFRVDEYDGHYFITQLLRCAACALGKLYTVLA